MQVQTWGPADVAAGYEMLEGSEQGAAVRSPREAARLLPPGTAKAARTPHVVQ